ncbi:hypothetical protein [Luteolibacter sp. AS25]|uniref:hypothetical protein n=1 Tax=Luteolibacter sp. AS25 TaxID=3135776 RepID=UPI00398AABF2
MNLNEKFLTLCAAMSIFLGGALSAEELLLYSGLPVSIPDSAPLPPFAQNRPSKELKQLKFERQFFIRRDTFMSLPEPTSEYGEVAVTAIEAIGIAMKDVNPDDTLQSFIVTAVQLLRCPAKDRRQIEYYLVSMLANGSEEHRIVLMNRSILAPKLKRLEE